MLMASGSLAATVPPSLIDQLFFFQPLLVHVPRRPCQELAPATRWPLRGEAAFSTVTISGALVTNQNSANRDKHRKTHTANKDGYLRRKVEKKVPLLGKRETCNVFVTRMQRGGTETSQQPKKMWFIHSVKRRGFAARRGASQVT
jgi:hypothetical protein